MTSENIEKVFRGTLTNWQLHHLSISQQELDETADLHGMARMLPLIVTGTVKEDPSGRMPMGFHIRTSALTFINEDEGYCETKSSVYRLEGENGNDVIPDLGDGVFHIFY